MIYINTLNLSLETPYTHTQTNNVPINNLQYLSLLSAAQKEINSLLLNKHDLTRTSTLDNRIDIFSNKTPNSNIMTVNDICSAIILYNLGKGNYTLKKDKSELSTIESSISNNREGPLTKLNQAMTPLPPINDDADNSKFKLKNKTNSSLTKTMKVARKKSIPLSLTDPENINKKPPTLENRAILISKHIEKHPYDAQKDIYNSLNISATTFSKLIKENNINYTSKQNKTAKKIRKSMFKKIRTLKEARPKLKVSKIAKILGYSYGMVKNTLKK